MSGASPSANARLPGRHPRGFAGGDPLADGAAASAALEICIARLEEVVDQETAALKRRASLDLREFNNRKSQGLLDLTRSLRVFQGAAPGTAALARLAGLRAKLDLNQAVLKQHLEAVREIATVMSDAIRDADSDGTYSPAACGVVRAYD
jgi:hypothetical protein